MKTVFSDKAPSPIGPYAQAIIHNGLLYASGMIAIDPKTGLMKQDDIKTETRQVMDNINALLRSAGADFDDVIKCSIFISDMNQFSNINEVYGGYFKDHFPARETVQVARLPKDANVEISVIARIKEN